jgi:cell division protein FtsW
MKIYDAAADSHADGSSGRNPGRSGHAPHEGADFLGVFMFLAILGFVTMWSASAGFSLRMDRSAAYMAMRQALFFLPAAILFIVTSRFSLDLLRKLAAPLMLFCLVLLVLPLLPVIGVEKNGARRWINLGFMNFQPSELWKPLSIIYLANILDRKRDTIRSQAVEALFPAIIMAAGVILIYAQDDFSTSMIALFAALTVFWLAGTPFRFFLASAVLVIPSIFIMIASSEYRLMRVLGFLIPQYDPHGMNYQVDNSMRAIMSGGLWGKGLGLGTRKLGSIPEIQSDFVFAAFAEELGFAGVLMVFACLGFLVVSVVRMARKREGFGYLLSLGLLGLLCLQFLVNLGVVSGFLPATGIALPFFSSGGSSLLSTSLAGGLIYNVARNSGFEPVATDDPAGSPERTRVARSGTAVSGTAAGART